MSNFLKSHYFFSEIFCGDFLFSLAGVFFVCYTKLEETARYKKRSEYTRSRSNFQKFTGQECDLCIYDGTYLGTKTSQFSEVFTYFKQKLLTISGFLGILSTVEVVP